MATLHLMTGLPCSGKTTKAKQLEKRHNALLLSPDVWYIKLFGRNKGAKYNRNQRNVEFIMWTHASRVLSLGVDVILDYGFPTRAERDKYREMARALGVNFKIHYMDVPVKELYKRITKRNKVILKNFETIEDAFIIFREDMDVCVEKFEAPSSGELK